MDKDNFKARCKLCPDHKRNFLILKYEQILDLVRNYIRQHIAAIPAEDLTQRSHPFEEDCVFGYEQPTTATLPVNQLYVSLSACVIFTK